METTTAVPAEFAAQIEKAAINVRREKLVEESYRLVMRSAERMKASGTRLDRAHRLLNQSDILLQQYHIRHVHPCPVVNGER